MNSQLLKSIKIKLTNFISLVFKYIKQALGYFIFGLWFLFGSLNWTPPKWFKTLRSKWKDSKLSKKTDEVWESLRSNPKKSIQWATVALVLVTSIVWGGFKLKHYYDTLPKPDYASTSISGPEISNALDGSVYGFTLYFTKSVAPLDQIGQPIKDGISISPKINGTWTWKTDKSIEFMPIGAEAFKTDWRVGEDYQVYFDKKIFAPHILFEEYSFKFKTPELKLEVTKGEFYIDPKNEKSKKIVFNVKSNYPVDVEGFKKQTTLKFQSEKSSLLSKSAQNLKYSINFNKHLDEIYIESENVSLPAENHIAKLIMSKGLQSKRGGQGLNKELTSDVQVLGIYDALKITSPQVIFARNEKFEPEQVLVFESGIKLKNQSLSEVMSLQLLPADFEDPVTKKLVKNYEWSSPSEVTQKVKNTMKENAEPFEWKLIPGIEPQNAEHSVRLTVPVKRYLFLTIKKGLKGLGGYTLKDTFSAVVQVPNYTPELLFMSEGSILTLSGEHKLSVLSRNVKKIKYVIARILPSNSNMLVSKLAQSESFSKPYIYSDLEHSVSEIFEETSSVNFEDAASTNYGYLDLNTYIKGGRGLYYVRAYRFESNEDASSASYSEDEGSDFYDENGSYDHSETNDSSALIYPTSNDKEEKGRFKLTDTRLVMITDLGIIAKATSDKTTILFVQNLSSGQPVDGAKILVLGRNGLPIIETETDSQGRAEISDLSHFINEKEPIAFVAKRNDDIAYLPYQMSERLLSYSRFDVGGEFEESSGDAINAMLFSDRGIYRPGESINIGILLRSQVIKPANDLPFTISVTDPLGQLVSTSPIKASLFGLKDFQFSTRESSPTGIYTIELSTAPRSGENSNPVVVGSTTTKVEEFVPDKLKISAQMNPQKKLGWAPLGVTEFSVSINNLFGTPSENTKVEPSLTLTPTSPKIPKFKDYYFINPNSNLNANTSNSVVTEYLQTTTTNAKGLAIFESDFGKYKGFYSVRFSAEGFESQSGRSVSAFAGGYVSHLKFLLGYKTDGNLSFVKKEDIRKVELVALNSDFESSAADVVSELFINNYVSSLVKQSDGTYKYQSVKKEESIKKENLKLTKSVFNLNLPTENAGSYTFVFSDKDGHELNRFDFNVIGDTNLTRSLDRSAELQLTLNKETFSDGEEIEINIISPYAGSGLITLERESVYVQKWFKTSTNSTTQKIRIPAGFVGNGYVNVTFLRASDSKEIYMSPLSYAVVPFSVNADKQKINITLSHPEKVKPGEQLEIKYSSSQPTSIILYGVDEGILQVAKYKTPDPIGHYFKKRALQVTTYQLLDLVLPEFSLLKQSYSTGGDDSASDLLGANLNPFKNKRLAPVVFWSGVIPSSSTPKTFKYLVPDHFNGSIKVFAVANTSLGMGSVAQSLLSVADFVISPTPPRFVSPSDEFEVGVLISNQSESKSDSESIEVSVETNSFLQASSDLKKTIVIPQGRELGTSFKFKANQSLGEAELTFKATNGKQASALKQTLSVRPVSPYITTTQFDISSKKDVEISNRRNMFEELSKSRLQVSATPMAFGFGLSEYLENYQYSCTEQLLSKAIPSVFLPEVYAAKGLDKKPTKLKSPQEQHKETIALLRSRQTSSGGFALYSGSQTTNLSVSLYVILYLIEARDRGFQVPDDLLILAKEFLNSKITHKTKSLSEVREFAKSLYLQARLGLVPGNDLNFLVEKLNLDFKKEWKTDLTAVWIAGTYGLIQKSDSGWALLDNFNLESTTPSDYFSFYDANVRNATLIYVVSKHFPDKMSTFMNSKTLEILLTDVRKAKYNTFSAAQMIMALSAYSTYASSKDFPGALQIVESKKGLDSLVGFDQTSKNLDLFLDPKSDLIKIKESPLTPFFYALSVSGFENELPKEIINKGMEADRSFSSEKIKQGDTISVSTKIRSLNDPNISHVVLVDLFPAGFELILDSVETKSNFIKSVDKRDDRLVVYLDLNKDMTEVKYKLKAVNKGSYTMPPIYSEAMYNKDIQYRGLSKKIEVL